MVFELIGEKLEYGPAGKGSPPGGRGISLALTKPGYLGNRKIRIRIAAELVRELGWILGDYVNASLDKEDRLFLIKRTNKKEGWRIRNGYKNRIGQVLVVEININETSTKEIFLNGKSLLKLNTVTIEDNSMLITLPRRQSKIYV